MVTVLSGHFWFHKPPMSFLSAASVQTVVSLTVLSTDFFRSALGHQQAVSGFCMLASHSVYILTTWTN